MTRPRDVPTSPRNIWIIPRERSPFITMSSIHRARPSGENGFGVWFDDPHENYVDVVRG
jgi:hypothetical protein